MHQRVLSSTKTKRYFRYRDILISNYHRGKTEFTSKQEYLTYLAASGESNLPHGFNIATQTFSFTPTEAPHFDDAQMTMTLIAPKKPTANYAAVFTKNAFPGAPVRIGREILRSSNQTLLGGIIVNNKVSNVGTNNGTKHASAVCNALKEAMNLASKTAVLPSSTGVIGWKLPVDRMIQEIPSLLKNVQSESIMPAANGICTTDLYPKVRGMSIGQGSVVGIAKGAGMIEPNLATMLSFILTDVAVPQVLLQKVLSQAVERSFNCISVDSDTSTSDTVVILSSNAIPFKETDLKEFEEAVAGVCESLAQDVVRNGEGVEHVLKVQVCGAPAPEVARGVGKAVINSPLFKCAVAGNDPNVGRLVMAIGKYLGDTAAKDKWSLDNCKIHMGGTLIFNNGKFCLNEDVESTLVSYMKHASLKDKSAEEHNFPRHERTVDINIDLGICENNVDTNPPVSVTGADLTHEYVSVNADYRS